MHPTIRAMLLLATLWSVLAVRLAGADLLRFLMPTHELQIITHTEMTSLGTLLRPVSPAQPAYYAAVSTGYRDFGGISGGIEVPPKEDVFRAMARVLSRQGYLPMNDAHMPTLLLSWSWGTLNRDYLMNEEGEEALMTEQRVLRFLGAHKVGSINRGQNPFGQTIPSWAEGDLDMKNLREFASTDLFVASIIAYDYVAFTQRRERKLLWVTRISCPSIGHSLPRALPVMLALAGPTIGRNTPRPVFVHASDRLKPEVMIGEIRVVDDADVRKLPIVESPALDPAVGFSGATKRKSPPPAKKVN